MYGINYNIFWTILIFELTQNGAKTPYFTPFLRKFTYKFTYCSGLVT